MNPGLYYLLSPYWAASESALGLGTFVGLAIGAAVIGFLVRGGRQELDTTDAGRDGA